MKRDHNAIRAELESLKADGVIRPVDVVEHARNPQSALHECFTWDDTEAAAQFRLLEARNLMRVYVVMEQSDATPVRAFVSLTTDRSKPGGGYRTMTDVMNDAELQGQMLADAFKHLRVIRDKYNGLRALAKVWQAVDEAEAEQESDQKLAA